MKTKKPRKKAASTKEHSDYVVRFSLQPCELKPLPDFHRLKVINSAELPRDWIDELAEKAGAGDEAALRKLVHNAIRLCQAIKELPNARTGKIRDALDYWPELKRQHIRFRQPDMTILWNQYALNALRTLREAHSKTLALLQDMSWKWDFAKRRTQPMPDAKKLRSFMVFTLIDSSKVRIPTWRIIATHLPLWPIDEQIEIAIFWRPAEMAIREFWEANHNARDEAFKLVRGSVEASGICPIGKIRDAVLKEIKRSFFRILRGQIKDTRRAIGPNLQE